MDLKAWQEVLVAAVRLAGGDVSKEFSEWDLTVETWRVNPARWGLRGYEKQHPDHKRVMMEIMGADTIVKEGLLEKTKTNHYRVTPAGMAKGMALTAPMDTRQRGPYVYDSIEPFAFHRVFEAFLKDPNEPRTWLAVASFLSLKSHEPKLLEAQLGKVQDGLALARKFMQDTQRADLRRGDSGRTITHERLDKLEEFLRVLEDRFGPQFAAIRAKA